MAFKQVLLAALAITATAFALYTASKSKAAPKTDAHKPAFKAYVTKHKKQYQSQQEFEYRYSVYVQNKAYINKRNSEALSFTLAENKFTDLSFEEFKNKYLSKNPIPNKTFRSTGYSVDLKGKSKDWRDAKVISEVKNQGACGSCWAFSTTGSLEAAYAIKNGAVTEFSESELVDCSAKYGNDGCDGGIMAQAFDYIKDNQIAAESDYPYQPVTRKCKADKKKTRYSITGYQAISPGDVTGLIAGINTTPVSVAIEVRPDFQSYSSGIYTNDDSTCGEALNHGVLAVGYSQGKKNSSYFIVKNSWGGDWGEEGYVRMAIGTGSGTCGIASDNDVFPSV